MQVKIEYGHSADGYYLNASLPEHPEADSYDASKLVTGTTGASNSEGIFQLYDTPTSVRFYVRSTSQVFSLGILRASMTEDEVQAELERRAEHIQKWTRNLELDETIELQVGDDTYTIGLRTLGWGQLRLEARDIVNYELSRKLTGTTFEYAGGIFNNFTTPTTFHYGAETKDFDFEVIPLEASETRIRRMLERRIELVRDWVGSVTPKRTFTFEL